MTQRHHTHTTAVVLTVLCTLLALKADRAAAEPRIAGEVAIESKLLAPCCWIQTLDMHESPLSTALRAEIRSKLQRGVQAAEIEAELVARYGERVRAIPAGHDPRTSIMNLGFAAMGLALAGVWLIARRWRRKPALGAATHPSETDAFDRQLDAELRALDL